MCSQNNKIDAYGKTYRLVYCTSNHFVTLTLFLSQSGTQCVHSFQVRVTRDEPDNLPVLPIESPSSSGEDSQMAPHDWNNSKRPSTDFLSPYTFSGRNSLCSVSGNQLLYSNYNRLIFDVTKRCQLTANPDYLYFFIFNITTIKVEYLLKHSFKNKPRSIEKQNE